MRYEEVAYVEYKGVKISNICYQNVHDIVTKAVKDKQRGYICLTEVSNLIAATKNDQLRTAINESLFSLADGTPLAWYARIVGCKEIERISGGDLMRRLLADMEGCTHYLLGDTEQTINKVITEAKKLNSQIKISGYSPPFKTFDSDDNQQIIDRIRTADPDIIWISFGGVKQEKWMNQNIVRLDKGVMIGAGAAFRFLTGDIMTPPQLFQKMGLQWLFRIAESFIKNPRHCLKTVSEREILKSKMIFLANLPHEITAARQKIKMLHPSKPQGVEK